MNTQSEREKSAPRWCTGTSTRHVPEDSKEDNQLILKFIQTRKMYKIDSSQ